MPQAYTIAFFESVGCVTKTLAVIPGWKAQCSGVL